MPKQRTAALSPSLRRWLLGASDPSVRLRVHRELLGRPARHPEVVRARREIGRTGWAAGILGQQLADGQWDTPGTSARELYRPKYIATNWRLLVLADLGVRGTDPRVEKAVDLFLRRFSRPNGGDLGGPGSEACFTGNAVRMLYAFGRGADAATRRSVDWILRTQKRDGGWHCFPSRTGTLDAWEPLSGLAAIPSGERSDEVRRAIARGAEFFLARGLLREGPRPYAAWQRLHYPVHYYYDLLVGLDLLTRLGYGKDPRLRPALARLEAKRNPDGTWDLDALHPDVSDPSYGPGPVGDPFYPFGLELPGQPSRWITVSALAVLARSAD